jgi:ParB-like chromosome segregation protein Spo0J
MPERRVEYEPIDQLIGAPSNPRRHRVDIVRRSIARFGYVSPAIVDERTGRLVVGHGRTEALCALRDAGDTPPEGVRQREDGAWLVPVLRGWSSRSDEEAAAYLVADNRHTELGGWDNEALAKLLDDIGDPDLVDLTGWSPDELAELLDSAETLPDEGDASTEPTDVVWGVAVTCRDEREQTDLLQRLTDEGYQVRALM